jgi:hypothetical protein
LAIYSLDRDLNHPAAHQAIKASLLRTADATRRPGHDGLIRVWFDCKFVDRLAQMRGPAESYSYPATGEAVTGLRRSLARLLLRAHLSRLAELVLSAASVIFLRDGTLKAGHTRTGHVSTRVRKPSARCLLEV